jgi:hypothetical protein
MSQREPTPSILSPPFVRRLNRSRRHATLADAGKLSARQTGRRRGEMGRGGSGRYLQVQTDPKWRSAGNGQANKSERRVGEMMAERSDERAPVGNPKFNGSAADPLPKPTLSEAGIDKHLADRARKYAAIPEQKFETILAETEKNDRSPR